MNWNSSNSFKMKSRQKHCKQIFDDLCVWCKRIYPHAHTHTIPTAIHAFNWDDTFQMAKYWKEIKTNNFKICGKCHMKVCQQKTFATWCLHLQSLVRKKYKPKWTRIPYTAKKTQILTYIHGERKLLTHKQQHTYTATDKHKYLNNQNNWAKIDNIF